MLDGKINIAITGTLSEPRAEVAKQINATTNGRFVESVTLETHYLVCEKYDSQKARKAGVYGTAIISEAELREFLAGGSFPSIALPTYFPPHPNNFPEIIWSELWNPPRWFRLTYRDAVGRVSVRTIIATAACEGWIGAYDGPHFKTFRTDRIILLEAIRPAY